MVGFMYRGGGNTPIFYGKGISNTSQQKYFALKMLHVCIIRRERLLNMWQQDVAVIVDGNQAHVEQFSDFHFFFIMTNSSKKKA